MNNRLIQSGPRNARIMIVGEAPGKTEDETGQPFVGGAGALMDQMLSRAGILRHQCFITNVAHVRPPNNDFKWFLSPAGQPHLLRGILQLKSDIEQIRPNVIIAFGAQPLQVLTGKKGITDWRGSILPSTLVPSVKVIASYHPAAILRQWDYKSVTEFDLKRIKEESFYPEIIYPARNLYLPNPDGTTTLTTREGLNWTDHPEPQHTEPLIEEMLAAKMLSVDIECVQDANKIWRLSCVGFSDRPDRALVIACNSSSNLHNVRRLCEHPVPKVMQNGMFDYTVLQDNGIIVNNFAYDTMFAHHTLYAESASGDDEIARLTGKKRSAALAKGLAFQTSIYTREPFYKSDGKLWKESGDIRVFYRYNALDACVTKEIQEVQIKEMDELGITDLFHKSYMRLVPHVLAATRRGIKIDIPAQKKMKAEIQEKVNNLQNFIDNYAGTHLNVKSSKQMVAFLYEKLRLPKRRGARGNYTADKDTLIELGNISHNPVLHSIIQLRQQRDLIERYLDTPVGPDLRMRCSFDLAGTRSGRLSSRASLDGTGTNLQNQPEEVRRVFVADPGTCFVYRDYSQAEARVVAYLARCQGLIELFEDPSRDIHTENAARIFGHSVALREKLGGPVTETERYLAKRVVHACNYGMEAKRLVEVVNEDAATTGVRINLSQARSLVEKYFLLYPEIKNNFWNEVEKDVRHTRMLSTPFGRKRMFFGRWDDKLLREAYSYIPQSTIGDLGRFAWVNIAEALQQEGLDAIVLLNVHDSLLVQCKDDDAEHVAHLMRTAMDIPIELNGYSFRIPTDCKVGHNWGNATEDNPDGLVEMKGW